MKIKKSLIPRREDIIKKKKEKTLTSNFESINPEKIFIKNILQKNASLSNLKEEIQQESNNNMHEIFSSDESRMKAIKYVLNVSKGKENKKNYMNQNPKNNVQNKKNLSFISWDVPIPEKAKNIIKVKRSQNTFYNKIEQLSPIKKDKFFNDDKPLNEDDILKDNNIIYDSPSSLIPINQSYDVNSKRELNLQIIQPNNQYELKKNKDYNKIYLNNNAQNLFHENNIKNKGINPNSINNYYHKVNYAKKQNEKSINPKPDYNIQNIPKIYDILRNKTIDNFYIYNQFNKSESSNYNLANDNNFNNYKKQQEKKNVFSNKNNSYDVKYNLNDNYNHRKNISQDDYSNNLQIRQSNKNKLQFYKTEINNFYEPVINNNRMNYLNNSKKLRFWDANIKNKNIIRIRNNNHKLEDLNNNNYYLKTNEQKYPLKKKNNSFYISDSNIIKNNKPNSKDYIETEYNNNLTKTTNNANNNYSFNKKIIPNRNFYIKTTNSTNNDNSSINYENKENINILNNKILVKKRPLKESQNLEIIINDIDKSSHKYKNNYNNNKYFICQNISFKYKSKNKNKIIFENEDEIADYIKKKFEEDKKFKSDKKLKYTGFILTKKYKGKILYEIRIDDDIDKINKKLQDENVQVNNELIKIISSNQKDELYKLKEEIINLEKEISKLKEENENLTKKDFLKNESITKLEKEKENIIEENKKLCIELDKIKQLNNNLNEQLKGVLDRNKNENDFKKYEIENILEMNIKNNSNRENLENKNLEDENIEINKTPKNIKDSNNVSINLNISNEEVEVDSKKSNPLSIFRLSKVSEIKVIKMDNPDSGDKDIKYGLELLNGKSNNKPIDNNNIEVNSFNENLDE